MGLYYKLNNGEYIEIKKQGDKVEVLLFNGSMTVSYNKEVILNDIIVDIENKYNELKNEDWSFAYSCYCD